MNTAPPEGVKLLKPKNEIEKMGDESEVVHSSGLLNRYMKRPSSLENVTLADWAALYDSPQSLLSKSQKILTKITSHWKEQMMRKMMMNSQTANEAMQNTKQPKPKQCLKPISEVHIRSVWFNVKSQTEKHYCQLFTSTALHIRSVSFF